MPVNRINISFTSAEMTAIQTANAALDTNFSFAQNLTVDERTSLPNVQNERFPYMQRTIEIHGPANPQLVSGFAGSMTEATTDWTLVKQCNELLPHARAWVEKLEDTQQIAGTEVYKFMLSFYDMAKLAAKNNMPGADTIVNDLKTLFENQGPH